MIDNAANTRAYDRHTIGVGPTRIYSYLVQSLQGGLSGCIRALPKISVGVLLVVVCCFASIESNLGREENAITPSANNVFHEALNKWRYLLKKTVSANQCVNGICPRNPS
ncbi:MAG: hypothetical protein AAF542_01490 [Pseudomonadota bacterium]